MPPRRHPIITKEQLIDMYFNQKMSLDSIARETQTNYRCVRDSFKVHGLTWRSKSEAGFTKPPMDDETKGKISEARTGFKDTDETKEKKRVILASICNWTKGVPEDDPRRVRQREASAAAMRRPEVRDALSLSRVRQIQTGGFYGRGYHESPKVGRVYYMSGWELRRWIDLDADPTVVTYMRSPCWIPYQWEGDMHRYVPDVLITYMDGLKVLEEIKPLALLTNYSQWQAKLLAKVKVGEDFAKTQGWIWRVFSYN